ncbi:MAG TPA: hypothetical protein VKE22_06525 [Haliangiales bacterium]|nr:hypothetical protein [Haliangiales bacterium]
MAPPRDGSKSSVERSLEEFIARANAVAPPPPAPEPTVLDDEGGPRRARLDGGAASARSRPVDDRTEIVSRPLPYTPPGRRLTWLLVALAFAAGGVAVVLAVRLISPRPAPAPIAPVVPPVVVIPQPTVEKLPEPVVEPAPQPAVAEPPAAAHPTPPPPAQTTKKRAVKKAEKAPTGLVDPFAE